MYLTEIRVRNILGARDIKVEPSQPVTLFCGFNGAGKSSIQESIRLAFQAETLRVTHKKDFPMMVTDGAKEGFVKIVLEGAEIETAAYEFRLPGGDHVKPEYPVPADQLDAVLNAQRFAAMTLDERRAFLMTLTRAKPNAEKIRELLREAGIEESRIELTLPMLKAGFPAACDMAKQKATEAKGAWKALTGENYGSKKAEGWEAPDVASPAPEEIELARANVTAKEAELARLQQELGGLNERARAARDSSTSTANAQKKVANLPKLQDKLARDESTLAEYEAELARLQNAAGTAPKEGLVHDLAVFVSGILMGDDALEAERVALVQRYEAEHGAIAAVGDPDAAAKIPAIQTTITLMKTAIANDKNEIADAEASKRFLATAAANHEPVSEQALTTAKQAVDTASNTLAGARTELQAMEAAAKAAAARDATTTQAATHHADVNGWTKVADQFAPDGIPAQILAKALEPINQKLRDAAVATGWRQVTIGSTMAITAGGRLYGLHSESERWMIDAMIACVISQLAGMRMLMLDRFDVLDLNHRPALLYWLSDLANAGVLEQALVFGTLKAAPSGLPDNMEAIWIAGGEIEANGTLAAA